MRLMTYNVNYANPDVDGSIDAVERADVDVVLLQEITRSWREALIARLGARYPHRELHVDQRQAGGIGVLSKLPIDSDGLLPVPAGGAWFPAQRTVLQASFGTLQILNVHLRPPWDNGWVTGFLSTPPVREKEIIAHWQALRDLPTLVAGDFNEDANGRVVAYLTARGLARVPTTGPTTWHYDRHGATLISLDIDHVMIDARLLARDAHVLDAGASDHRPVVATIGYRPNFDDANTVSSS